MTIQFRLSYGRKFRGKSLTGTRRTRLSVCLTVYDNCQLDWRECISFVNPKLFNAMSLLFTTEK